MAPPPVPDFLSLNGTPDTRAPGPPVPESQLPPTPHIPGTFGIPENNHTGSKVLPQDPGTFGTPENNHTGSRDTENPGNPEKPGDTENPVIPAKRYHNHNKTPGPRPQGFINYPGAENGGSEIADAIAVLARANIQVIPPGGVMPTPHQEMNPEFRKLPLEEQTFLRVLEKSGRITFAAEIAGKSRNMFRNRRKKDPVFADLWDRALKHRAEIFEDEAIRRAVEGVRKDIYYQGAICGSERVYSDSLLSKLLEGNMPQKYRQNHKIELEGKMAVATLVLPATTTAEEWAAQNEGNIIEQEPEDEYS